MKRGDHWVSRTALDRARPEPVGLPAPTARACARGRTGRPEDDDCDDTDASAHPGATDDGVDEDCDGVADPRSAALAAWTVRGLGPGDGLGGGGVHALADLHADGRPDLAVSAPGQDATGTDAGTLYVVPGY